MNRINFTFNAENFMKIKKEITLSLTIIFFFIMKYIGKYISAERFLTRECTSKILITQRKPLTCHKLLTNFITKLHQVVPEAGIELSYCDCCLRSSEQMFWYIMWPKQTTFVEIFNVCFVLRQILEWNEFDFYSASCLKQQFTGRHVDSLRHIKS